MWFTTTSGFAQNFPHRFQTYNTSNGLTTNFCNSIVQDAKGYLYVGTRDGLHRFNSYSFQLITMGFSNKVGEGDTDNILIDNKNRLWFARGTQDLGVGMLDLKDVQSRVYFPFSKTIETTNGVFNAEVRKLAFDSNGHLWAGSHGNGLYRFDTLTKKAILWPARNPNTDYYKYVRSLTLYKRDTLFVGLINGLSIINPITGNTTHLSFKNTVTGKPLRPTIRKILPWHLDTFVVATDRGLWFLHINTGNLIEINPDKKGLQLHTISGYDVVRHSDEELWFATEKDGVLFFNTRTGQHAYAYELQIFNEGVAKGQANAFYRDDEGNTWVAHEFGMSVHRRSFNRFLNYSHGNEYPFLPRIVIADGSALVGMDARRISRFEIAKALTRQDSLHPPKEYKDPSFVFKHETLGYVTFSDKRFFCINPVTLAVKELAVKPLNFSFDTLGHFRVMDCLPVRLYQKDLWLLHGNVPYGTLLLLYDPVNGQIWEETRLDSRKYFTISKIIQAPDGRFWISTRANGIYRSEERSLKSLRNLTQATTNGGLPANNVSDLLADGNCVWATVYGAGLVKIESTEKGDFRFGFFNKGLDDPFLFRMVPSGTGKIWITGLNGLLCFDTKSRRFRRYSLDNGIRNTKFGLFDTFNGATSDGYLYFSDRGNIIVFKADSISPGEQQSRLILSSAESGTATYNSTYQSVTPQFSHNDNTLSFTYDVLNYENEKNPLVKYRLEGFDKAWTETKDFNKIIYRHLPGGDYTFRIRLIGPDGSEGNEQSVRFHIATVWYKTSAFYAAVIVMISALLYGLYRYKLRQQLKIFSIRQRLHRDLHDDVGATLSSIKAYSEILGQNGRSEIIQGLIKENAADMIDRLEVISWATNPQYDTFKSLTDAMLKFARPLLHSHNVQLVFVHEGMDETAPLPGDVRQNFLLVFKEAVNNLVKYAEATECRIDLAYKNHRLTLAVSDNGKGINGQTTGGGHGLKNMRKRAAEMGGTLEMQSDSSEGTIVRLTAPHPFQIPKTW